jgi:hypothetical protein
VTRLQGEVEFGALGPLKEVADDAMRLPGSEARHKGDGGA